VLTGLIAMLGAGCGDGSGDEGSGTSAKALAKVRAADYARHVGLHASDVPYFEAEPSDDDDEDPRAEKRRQRELERCLGFESDEDEDLAEVSSPVYGTQGAGFLQVESTVTVARELERADEAMTLLRSRLAERCLRELVLDQLAEEETAAAEAREVDLERIPFPAPELGDGFAYRLSASVAVSADTSAPVAYHPAAAPQTQEVDVYVDLLGFLHGRTSITLSATGAPSPVSKNLERNLLRAMHERAEERRP
jgi:hypothetical protein